MTFHRISRLRPTERYLPYGIAQCYLLPDTGKRALSCEPQPDRPVLVLLAPEGSKAELTLVVGFLCTEIVYLSGDSQLHPSQE